MLNFFKFSIKNKRPQSRLLLLLLTLSNSRLLPTIRILIGYQQRLLISLFLSRIILVSPFPRFPLYRGLLRLLIILLNELVAAPQVLDRFLYIFRGRVSFLLNQELLLIVVLSIRQDPFDFVLVFGFLDFYICSEFGVFQYGFE